MCSHEWNELTRKNCGMTGGCRRLVFLQGRLHWPTARAWFVVKNVIPRVEYHFCVCFPSAETTVSA